MGSPEVAGFNIGASFGEDDFCDVALRDNGELGGFKISAGIGYGEITDGDHGKTTLCGEYYDYEGGGNSRRTVDGSDGGVADALSPFAAGGDGAVWSTGVDMWGLGEAYVELGLGIGIVASMAIDGTRDPALRLLEAKHLFQANTARIAVRRGNCLRGYAHRFIELCSPELTEAAVRTGVETAPA